MFCWSLFVLLYFFFWPLCCLFFFDIRILIAPLVSFVHCVLYVLLRYTDSDYPFGIFCPLCCLFFFDIRILITFFLVSSNSSCITVGTIVYFVYLLRSCCSSLMFIFPCDISFVYHRSVSCCSSLMFIFPCRHISFVFHRSVPCAKLCICL